MKNLKDCYETLQSKDQISLREAFKLHFECSSNTFYRVLDDPNPKLKHLSWFYENAGFAYDFKKSVYSVDVQAKKHRLASRLGLVAA